MKQIIASALVSLLTFATITTAKADPQDVAATQRVFASCISILKRNGEQNNAAFWAKCGCMAGGLLFKNDYVFGQQEGQRIQDACAISTFQAFQ